MDVNTPLSTERQPRWATHPLMLINNAGIMIEDDIDRLDIAAARLH